MQLVSGEPSQHCIQLSWLYFYHSSAIVLDDRQLYLSKEP